MSRRNLMSSTCSVLTTGGTAIRLMSTDDLMSCDDRFARKLKKKTISPPLPTPLKSSKALKPLKNSFRFPNGEVFNPRNSTVASLPPKLGPLPATSQFRGGKVKQLLQKFQQVANQNALMAKNNGYKRKSTSQKTQLVNQLRSLVSDIATNLKDTSSTASGKDSATKLQLHNICTTQLLVLLPETDSNPLLLLNYNRSNTNTPTTSISNSIEEETGPGFLKTYNSEELDAAEKSGSSPGSNHGKTNTLGTSSEEGTLKELFNDASAELAMENFTSPQTGSTTSPKTPKTVLVGGESEDLDPMDDSSCSESDSDLDSSSAHHVTEESRTTFIEVPEEEYTKGDVNRASRDVSLVSINDKILEDVNKESYHTEKDETSILDSPEQQHSARVSFEDALDQEINIPLIRTEELDQAGKAPEMNEDPKGLEKQEQQQEARESSEAHPEHVMSLQHKDPEPELAQLAITRQEKPAKTIKVDPTAKPTPYSEFKVVRRNFTAPVYNYEGHNAPHRMVATMEAGRLSSMPTEADMALFMAANQTDEDDVPPRRDIVGRNYSLRRMKEILLAGTSTNSEQVQETSPNAADFEAPPPVDASFRQSVLALMLLAECIPFPTSRPQLVAEVEDDRKELDADVEGDDTLIEDDSIQHSSRASAGDQEESVPATGARGSGSSTSSSNSHTLTSAENTPSFAESANQAPVHHVKAALNKKFNRAEYTISPIIESPPGSPFPTHLLEKFHDNNFPSPTIGPDVSYGHSSSFNENLQSDKKELPAGADIKPEPVSTPLPEFSKPLPKAPLKKASLTLGKPKSEPSSRNTSSSTLRGDKGPGFVGFFKKLFKKEKRSMHDEGEPFQHSYIPAEITRNSLEDPESTSSSPIKGMGNLDDILPTLEPDTEMFNDVLTNLDKYSRGSMLIRKSEPIFCDDELTRDQIEDQRAKDTNLKDSTINDIGIIGLQAPPKTFGKTERLLVAGSVSLSDYIDENILLLRREMGWMDQELLDQRLEMVKEANEIEPALEKSEETDFNDPYEASNETFTIYNEQLQNLFHNLTEGQRRALPMHLKYIRQFKDYAQLEITVKTEKFDVPSLDVVPKRASSKRVPNPKKLKVAFENKIFINETHSPDTYKRYNKLVTQYTLTEPRQIDRIKAEMNEFKCNEMLVHELLKKYTHFFY